MKWEELPARMAKIDYLSLLEPYDTIYDPNYWRKLGIIMSTTQTPLFQVTVVADDKILLDEKIFAASQQAARDIALIKSAKGEIEFDPATVKVATVAVPLA